MNKTELNYIQYNTCYIQLYIYKNTSVMTYYCLLSRKNRFYLDLMDKNVINLWRIKYRVKWVWKITIKVHFISGERAPPLQILLEKTPSFSTASHIVISMNIF